MGGEENEPALAPAPPVKKLSACRLLIYPDILICYQTLYKAAWYGILWTHTDLWSIGPALIFAGLLSRRPNPTGSRYDGEPARLLIGKRLLNRHQFTPSSDAELGKGLSGMMMIMWNTFQKMKNCFGLCLLPYNDPWKHSYVWNKDSMGKFTVNV